MDLKRQYTFHFLVSKFFRSLFSPAILFELIRYFSCFRLRLFHLHPSHTFLPFSFFMYAIWFFLSLDSALIWSCSMVLFAHLKHCSSFFFLFLLYLYIFQSYVRSVNPSLAPIFIYNVWVWFFGYFYSRKNYWSVVACGYSDIYNFTEKWFFSFSMYSLRFNELF